MKRISTYRDFLGELTVIYKRTTKPTVKITYSKIAADYIREYFDECMDDHEEFKIMHLNNNNNVVNIHHVSKGGVSGVLVDIKLCVREALHIQCQGVILVHNHPSSTLKPSEEDKKLTLKLRKAFALFDIQILDHIIITREDYYSMADNSDF